MRRTRQSDTELTPSVARMARTYAEGLGATLGELRGLGISTVAVHEVTAIPIVGPLRGNSQHILTAHL